MKENKEAKISYLAAHLTTIVSVTLVLLLIGIIAMVWVGAENETRRLKERIELSVVLADSIPDAEAQALAKQIAARPYAKDVRYVGKQEAMQRWEKETGENLEELFGVNPLSPEVDFTVRADYATSAQLASIRKALAAEPGVEEVASPDTAMVESMNTNLTRLTLILGIVALVMVFVSFVLINNTVHLTIYSRRFTIHTMQLVGATNGFIRKPIVGGNVLTGLIAGVLSSGLLAAAVALSTQSGTLDLESVVGWEYFAIIAGGLIVVGIVICALSSLLAANKYLRKDYDELFK